MLPGGLTEAQIYAHVQLLLNDHERMLADAPRNRAFYRALERRVRSDSVVLDIGAGTGLWAITAARLGAKRVVAVDSNELLLGLIKQLAIAAGVGDRVQPVYGYSTVLALQKEFDIVVSETIGFDGFDEAIIPIMADARTRFLKAGGALIPERVALWCAAGRYRPSAQALPAGMPLSLDPFVALNRHAPARLTTRRDVQLLSPPQCLIDADLYTAQAPFDLSNLRASWSIAAPQMPDCFVVWVESLLAPRVRMSTRQTSSWTPVIYRVVAPQEPVREIAFALGFSASTVHWEAKFGADDNAALQQHSPRLATHSILQALRASGENISPDGQMLIAALAG